MNFRYRIKVSAGVAFGRRPASAAFAANRLGSIASRVTAVPVGLPKWTCRALAPILVFLMVAPAPAMSYEHLRRDPDLTPRKFSRQFADFQYELLDHVQPADMFLRRKRGDCDDHASLADDVLTHKGFETRLVHVRLVGLTSHAVCYVTEDRAYIDYNNRNVFFTLTRSRPGLRDIADKVARSLNANWTAAFEYEFSYEDPRKRITAKVVRTQDPRKDPPPRKASPPANPFLVE